jgi:hypothetical protein
MPIGQFLGASFPKLRQGAIITGPFEQVSNFFPKTAVVPFGSLLMYTGTLKNYDVLGGAALASAITAEDASLFAGVAVSEIAATPATYPGIKTQFEIAEPGNVLIQGSIAVPFTTTAAADVDLATEGSKVYVDAVTAKVTNVSTNNLLVPNLVFTGHVEVADQVTLVGVRKLY